MTVKEGMKCRYKDYTGHWVENGKVLYTNEDGTFCCFEDMKCPAQYNDSFMDFKPSDIGKSVIFKECDPC